MSHHEDSSSTDTLCAAGGVALIILGAGLLVARPALRRYFEMGLSRLAKHGGGVEGVKGMLPDVERYLKIRSM